MAKSSNAKIKVFDIFSSSIKHFLNFCSYNYLNYSYNSFVKKAVQEAIDKYVARVLRSKFITGLFDEPYVDPDYAEDVYNNPEHKALALKAAREAIILLKNENNWLIFLKRGQPHNLTPTQMLFLVEDLTFTSSKTLALELNIFTQPRELYFAKQSPCGDVFMHALIRLSITPLPLTRLSFPRK